MSTGDGDGGDCCEATHALCLARVLSGFRAYQSQTTIRSKVLEWAAFLRSEEGKDEVIHLPRPNRPPSLSRKAATLVCLTANVTSRGMPDKLEGVRARDVFLALRPGIDVFLDLARTSQAKALRLAAEAGIPRWTLPERIAALLAVVDEDDHVDRLSARLLASIRVDARPAVIDRCIQGERDRSFANTHTCTRAIERHIEARRRAEEQRAPWLAATGAAARRALGACGIHGLLADRVFELAVASEAETLMRAADDVRADYLQTQIDTEVRCAERVFFTDEGNLSSTDVTPEGNKHVRVSQISIHGRRWTLAWQDGARVDVEGLFRELVAFIAAFRTKRTPGDYDCVHTFIPHI